jgi:hypothetical protein
MADAFPISGSIDPKAFPFLLMDLHRQGATGSLKVEGPSYQKALYFRNGRILFGSSNDPRDQLGAILIESGKITPEQLEDVNTKVGPGSPLAKVLADTGFVSQRELSEAARAKVERILSDVVTYTAGTFEFEDGVLPKGAVDLKLSTETLFLTAVARVSDRNFVLRHIEGLDAVLAPTRDLAERLSQIETEAGGLPQQLDGRRSLKEAAARTRLDEFEAAKVACALLFLGLVQRVDPTSPAAIFASVDADVLDLGTTAASAIESAVAPPPPAPSPAPVPVATPAPVRMVTPAPAPARAVTPAPAAPAFQFPAAAEPEVEAPTVVMRPAPVVTPPPAAKVWTPPAAQPVPPPKPPVFADPPTFPPTQPKTATSTRPSKEDLAALDALLNPRNLEGPLTPLEKPSSTQEKWVPQFGAKSGQARRAGRSGKGLVVGGAAAVVLLLVAAGGWYVMNRPGSTGTRVAAATPAPPTAAPPSLAAPSIEPAVTPASTLPVTTVVETPAPVATSRPAPPSPVPPRDVRPASGGGLGAARAALQAGRYDEAAPAFAAHVKGAAAGTSTIQLLVACSGETVQKAVQAAGAEDLFIVPTNFKGRDCYRLCWGLYPNPARAGSAMRSLPEYFRKGGASPRVLPAAEILP